LKGICPRERARIRNREIGFIFQSFNLIGDLTVYENVGLPLSYRGMGTKERKTRVNEALEKTGMAHRAKHLPSQLSGGQQQLVAVARAIVARPKLILADEPTGSLHSSQGREIMELFKKLNEEDTTIIQVTHNENWAAYGRKIINLADGWIVE
jgi:putative ABC transport system ATP-binding protein